jgi:hypothetical protein
MADHKLLRLSATLVFIGGVLYTVLTLFVHPAGGPTEEATFAINAASGAWTAIHLGQFVSIAVLLAGLLVLFFALNVSQGTPRWVGFFGAIAAGVTLALAGVQYALDGVANKQAEEAWVSAPAAEKAARLASAQALRWLEWGITSYQLFMFGLALVLLAIVIVWTARVKRPIGYLMGVSGLAWLVLGWVIGTSGFTSAENLPAGAGILLLLASSIWLLIVAWRMKGSVQAVPG